MSRFRTVTVAFVVALLAAACGGRDAEEQIGASPTLTPTEIETGEPSPEVSPPSSPTGTGDDEECEDQREDEQMTLEMKDDFFEPNCLTVHARQTVKIENEGTRVHNFSVPETSVDVDVDPGQEQNLEAIGGALPEGTFTFYCKYHGAPDGSGMAGEITISGTLGG